MDDISHILNVQKCVILFKYGPLSNEMSQMYFVRVNVNGFYSITSLILNVNLLLQIAGEFWNCTVSTWDPMNKILIETCNLREQTHFKQCKEVCEKASEHHISVAFLLAVYSILSQKY